MLQAGIVGLPNVGKSTLFNALTKTRKAEAANYPFAPSTQMWAWSVPDIHLPTGRTVSLPPDPRRY